MGHDDAPFFSKKHPAGETADPSAAEAVRVKAGPDGVACASAFKVAADLDISPAEVGKTIDLLDLKLTRCQLGLFGYPGQRMVFEPVTLESIPAGLKAAIAESLENGRLPCQGAWRIAERLGLKKMEVAAAADSMGVKIKPCQLGAF